MSRFADVNYMLGVISKSTPERGYLERPDVSRLRLIEDPPVTWAIGNHVVLVDANNIQFTHENIWYPGHAAAIVEGLVSGENPILETPAGRVFRVSQYDIESTQQEYADGTLQRDSGMIEPWEFDDLGKYHATLLDGNHRAAAAMLVGREQIPIYVGENYWENIDPKDWL